MRVRCIISKIANSAYNLKIRNTGWVQAGHHLTIGKEYEVYAFYNSYFGNGIDAYLICDDNFDGREYYWPIYIPTIFFEIIDSSKPDFWIDIGNNSEYTGPVELTMENYEALLDGDSAAVAGFKWTRCFISATELMRIRRLKTEDVIIYIDESINGTKNLIDHIRHSLNSPYILSQGSTWNSMEDELMDLSWISNKYVKIIHYNLPSLAIPDMKNYLRVLKRVTGCWEKFGICDTMKGVCLGLQILFRDTLKKKVDFLLN